MQAPDRVATFPEPSLLRLEHRTAEFTTLRARLGYAREMPPTIVCAAGPWSPARRGCRRQAEEQTMYPEMGRRPRSRS
jgi:hypothetical protein